MEPLTIREVKEAVRGNFESAPDTEEITAVSTDTRTLAPGSLFVALRGARVDGHDYIAEARQRGAAAVVCRRGSASGVSICRIAVGDTLQALGDLAAYYRRKFSTQIVAVTGSNGKTTVKDMIYHVLSSSAAAVKSPGSFNNLVGVPLSIFQIDSRCRFAVLEMGTSRPGEISRLSRIAHPQISVITSVCEAHIEGLRDIDGVAGAKAEIVHGMDEAGFLIVNGDDERCLAIAKRFAGKTAAFGFGVSADVRCTKVEKGNLRTAFHLADGTACDLPLLGAHNVLNAVACITACLRVGISREAAAEKLSTFLPARMRGQVSRTGGIILIDEAYNANPASFRAAIETLMSIEASRRVLVCGDMMELGEGTGRFHRDLGRLAARAGIDVLICVGSAAVSAGEEAVAQGVPESQVFLFGTSVDAAASIAGLLKEGDAVLVKGSRAMGMELIADTIMEAGDAVPSSLAS